MPSLFDAAVKHHTTEPLANICDGKTSRSGVGTFLQLFTHSTERQKKKTSLIMIKIINIYSLSFRYWCRWYCLIWSSHKNYKYCCRLLLAVESCCLIWALRPSELQLLICISISLHFNFLAAWKEMCKMLPTKMILI